MKTLIIWALVVIGGISVVSALDNEDSGYQKAQIYNPTNTPTSIYLKPTPTPYKTPQPNCHPSYSGCLRVDASDYDCAGGSGNGPYYTGRVYVYGPDVFGLDRDGDGIGCE